MATVSGIVEAETSCSFCFSELERQPADWVLKGRKVRVQTLFCSLYKRTTASVRAKTNGTNHLLYKLA